MKKIKNYVDELFKNVKLTREIIELKEELIADLTDKYSDLVKEGQSEEKAYKEVISGIGNIDELLKDYNTKEPNYIVNSSRKKTALVVSICVGIYILTLVGIIISEECFHAPDYITASILFIFGGIATCILIYHFLSIPKYKKQEESIVEDFKEWKKTKDKNKEIKSAINSVLWTLIVIIYFILNFFTNAWHISWIIFIIGALIEEVIKLIFKLKEYNNEQE